jgi:diaminohydroxyphosphoribosylaminopyrimidine deaminase/5-amino-6-(5-phosphoribosylamino)uracil reductase
VCAPGLTNAALENAGAVLLHSVADADGRIGIAGSLGELARRGIQRLMVEGGAMLAGQFLAAGLVDEAVVFTSPMILGPQGLAAPLPLSGLKAIEEEVLGDDCRSRYERV